MIILNYRPDIDGLRAVAVLAVVLHHLSATLVPGGYIGVDVFFVISGYLITGIISREMDEGRFTFARFYERRARRIFPALFTVLAATILAGYCLLLPSDYASTLRGAIGTLFFSSNIIFWRDMMDGYFAATDAGVNPLLHTWSLGVEEQFYVLFPILLLLCYRYCRRHLAVVFIAAAAMSLSGAELLVKDKSVAVFFLSPFRAWELLVGALLAINVVPLIQSRIYRNVSASLGFSTIIFVCLVYNDKTTFPGLAAIAPVLGAAAIIHAGASGSNIVGAMLRWRPMVYIGLISYSLYLWHWPLIVLTHYAIGMDELTPYVAGLIVASLALASLTYHFIEQPFRVGGRLAPPRRYIFASSVAFMSVTIMMVSVSGLMTRGFAQRFTPEVVEIDQARTPLIPFVSCDSRSVAVACMLGREESKPTVLLWGDSHLIAWAPALNASLSRLNLKALFVGNSSCPPLLGVESATQANCFAQNESIKAVLLANPDITMVVMSAYWSHYFNEDSPIRTQSGNLSAKGLSIASNALAFTTQWLHENSKQVVLLGPVPVYEKSVPLRLALKAATGREFIHTTYIAQLHKQALFFDALNVVKSHDRISFHFLNPLQWMCDADCIVTSKEGTPLYRDSNHLSIAGAMTYENDLTSALSSVNNKIISGDFQ